MGVDAGSERGGGNRGPGPVNADWGGGRGWYLRAWASGWLGRVNGDLGPGPVYFGLACLGKLG